MHVQEQFIANRFGSGLTVPRVPTLNTSEGRWAATRALVRIDTLQRNQHR